MDAATVLNIILPVVFIIVGIVLIWFLIELAKTVKTTRQAVDELQSKVTPTLDHVDKITSDLQPAITKVDPMMERLALTVDAVNLELMRVDQILEDVNDVTSNISKTSNAIDTVTSAPLNLVNNMTEKVRGALRSSHASRESVALAEAAAEEAALAEQAALQEELAFAQDGYTTVPTDAAPASEPFDFAMGADVQEPQNSLETTAEIPVITPEDVARDLADTAEAAEDTANSGYFTYDQGEAAESASE